MLYKINWLEEFEKFLMDNDCYSQFTSKLLEDGKTLLEYVEERLEKIDRGWLIENFVLGAFIWDSSFDWYSIHTKWFKYAVRRLG